MKKLFWVLALLCAPAFGQVYSEQAIQNTTGNWLKASPGASVYLCTAASTLANCTNGLAVTVIYTDQTLLTPLAQPILADSNGNFTIFSTPGVYNLCVKGATTYCEIISIGGGGNIVCPGAINGSIAAFTSPTNTSCDPTFLTDFFGNFTAQSGRFLGPVNGFVGLIGGGSDPGTQVKYKLATNEFRWLANTIPTPYYARVPSTACAVGQVWDVTSSTTDANGDVITTFGCLTPSAGGGGGIDVKTNGVDNANCVAGVCTLLNLQDGVAGPLGITPTHRNPSGGNVQLGATTAQVSTPATPSGTQNGTTGATTYSYKVVACQDSGGTCPSHTPASAAGTVANGNATLSSTNSITLTVAPSAQVRCYDWYRTVGGATQGKIASCASRSLIDTGLIADGSTAPTTNTTVLITRYDGYPCAVHPNMLSFGTADILPCSPNTADMEFTNTFGAPGDLNDGVCSWGNQQGATASWTNGMLQITSDTTAQAEYLICNTSLPSPPFTFTMWVNVLTHASASSTTGCFIGLRESSTSKMTTWSVTQDTPDNSGGANIGYIYLIRNWTSNSVSANQRYLAYTPPTAYLRLQDSSGNLVYTFSDTGNGVVFSPTFLSQSVITAFTTAPNQLIIGIDNTNANVTTCAFDFVRRTQ